MQPSDPFSLQPPEPRPSLAVRALRSKPGKITTKVITGLTIASGVVSVANSVAHALGNDEAVGILVQVGALLKLITGLF
jgi:hypothetical protein